MTKIPLKTSAKHLSLLLLGLLFSSSAVFAADEDLLFADFKNSVQAANPKLAQKAVMQNRTNPPTEKEMERFAVSLANASIKVMDQGAELAKKFPESKYLPLVTNSVAEALGDLFGMKQCPVPRERADDVEICIRALLASKRSDYGLRMALLTVAESLPTPKQIRIYKELSADATFPPTQSRATQRLIDIERLGKPFNLTFTALDGRKVDVNELKGKVVVVDFWATTCPPCLVMMPALKELYTRNKTNGLEVIGVSLDSDREKLSQFIQKNELSWPQYFDASGGDSPVVKSFGITGIPVVWLVDRQGLLRHLDARWELESKVESLLKEQP